MRRINPLLVALCGMFVISVGTAAAQELKGAAAAGATTKVNAPGTRHDKDKVSTPAGADLSEVENLKQRVHEIEAQNRELWQQLTEIKARLDAATRPALAAEAAAAPSPSPSTTPQATAQAGTTDKNQPVRWSEVISEGNRIKLYGFLRLDLIADSQRPNNAQSILFVNSPDPLAGNTDHGNFTLHPRLTRFGVDWTGPQIAKLGDAKLSGKLETDFQNGGSESRQIIRIRHAYLKLDWREASILAGQTWDVLSPLFPTVNNDTLQWNAGNIGDRRPQLRAAYEPGVHGGKLSLVGGIGLTGAVDALDLDANGVRDGEESARPDVQGRIGYSHWLGAKDRVASFGVSGFYSFLRTARPVAGRTEFRGQAVNIDFTLPVTARLAFKGEGWWGRNLSDVRGGAGQGINAARGLAIRGRGGWGEANVKVSRYLSINPGFSTDDPVDADIPANGRTRNRAFFLANRITPGGNLLFGADYLRWKTNFRGLRPGIDDRVNIFMQYNF